MKHSMLMLVLLMAVTGYSQTDKNKLKGTWVYSKTMVDGDQKETVASGLHADTVFITDKTFEQRCWIKESADQLAKFFKQSGELIVEKKQLTIVKRTTSISDQGPAPDIFYLYKLKGDALIVTNASAITNNKIEDDLVRMHYRRIR